MGTVNHLRLPPPPKKRNLIHLVYVFFLFQIADRLMLTLELLKKELAMVTLQQKLGKEVWLGGGLRVGKGSLEIEAPLTGMCYRWRRR